VLSRPVPQDHNDKLGLFLNLVDHFFFFFILFALASSTGAWDYYTLGHPASSLPGHRSSIPKPLSVS